MKVRKSDMAGSENSGQWFSVSRGLNFVWQRIFTASGALVAFAVAACIAFSLKAPVSLADYVFLPLVSLFALFLMSLVLIITAALGNILAESILSKVVKNPDPLRWTHQAIYILFSLPSLCAAAAFVACIRYY